MKTTLALNIINVLLWAALLVLLTLEHADAQEEYVNGFVMGRDLKRLCERQPIWARMYVTGVFDASQSIDADITGCIPMSVSAHDLTDVVCNYLNANDEVLDMTASGTSIVVMASRFCK